MLFFIKKKNGIKIKIKMDKKKICLYEHIICIYIIYINYQKNQL